MSRQSWEELLTWSVSDGTAVTNTVTETIIAPNVTIPANYLQDGRLLKLKASGVVSTTSSASPATIRLRWGGVAGTILATNAAPSFTASSTNAFWMVEAEIQTRLNGSAGTLIVSGVTTYGVATAPGTATVYPFTTAGLGPTAVTSLDLTADTALALTWTWGTAIAANTATMRTYSLEAAN